MGHDLLTDILLLLVVSIPIVVLLRRFEIPPLAGFLVAGAALGPHALGWIRAEDEVEAMAEIGVALLLFTVGLEFSIPRMLLLRRQLFLGGGGQVLATLAVVTLGGVVLGAETRTAILFGFLAALSSTAVTLKVLSDARQVDTPHGQVSIAILLFQDLAIIPLLLLVPLLAGGEGGGALGLALALGKAVLGVGVVLLLARFGFTRLAAVVFRAGGRELFTLFVVLVALGAAWVTLVLHLPLALGAFVAGLVVSESEYSHQVVDEILPFRDVFSALFFVSVGMLLDPRILVDEPLVVLGIVAGIGVVKGGIVLALAFALYRSWRVAVLAAAALFGLGEFSFVVARQANGLGILGGILEQRFLAAAVLTMLATPFAMQLAARWAARRSSGDAGNAAPSSGADTPQVVVAGYGLTGMHLSRVLSAVGVSHVVLELDPVHARAATADGARVVQGDASRLDGLVHAGIDGARALVVAINDAAATRRAVSIARGRAPHLRIFVRAQELREVEELRGLGADEVVPAQFETSLEIFARVLRDLHVPRATVALQRELIRREGYQLLQGEVSEARHLEVLGELIAATTLDTFYVSPQSPVCGHSLGELEFRARTGANVLSVLRGGEADTGPGPTFVVEPGDLLVVQGNHDQLDRARRLMAGQPLE